MKKAIMSKWIKGLTAGVLSAAFVLVGVASLSSTVKAEGEPAVHFTAGLDDTFNEWKNGHTVVPTEEGYLFGGWYKDASGTQPLKENDANDYSDPVYAKFVPSYVLSVKAQIDENTKQANDGNNASIRIITGADSLQYQYIGAQILLGNRIDTNAPERTAVYKNLLMSKDEGASKVSAKDLFGPEAEYLCAWNIVDIYDINDDSIIYVRPYWITMDGTKVYGLAKYVHVEDGYLNYVSVPINMMSGSQAAACVMTMNYNNTYLTDEVIMEKGRVFDDAVECSAANGTIKVVGNGATAGEYKSGETLLANVRFKLKDGTKLYIESSTDSKQQVRGDAGFLNFTITNTDFSDWNEQAVTNPGVWDIKY